ncbi:TraR/DksA family transcriptional regulator [Chitiniphilus purpureus]|uniref:TraR/DksA family transcriptional regulator n=1 Tax=Chitiniphilus purpureus TaxID=2981137 RepID=A0ABY6DK81_9NEIS|nr:TraR/DksA family transcriptional regulator [Chitiniphilus sp. CD1]UXY14770.1 TraR/DksA family transcriptional regulator [Chitiniphilus sp. CD1]
MDPNDIASELEQAARDEALSAARGRQRNLFRADCADCGDDLPPYRQVYGTCIDCQERREHMDKLRGKS